MFVPHASEIWTKAFGPNYIKFWAFWQKTGSFKTIFDKCVDAILEDALVAERFFNAKLLISRLSREEFFHFKP